MHHNKALLPSRISHVKKILINCQIESLIFFNINNIRYLSGFTGSDGMLLIDNRKTILLVDGRYKTHAKQEVKCAEIVEYKNKIEGIVQVVSDLRLKKIGYEAAAINVQFYNKLNERLTNKVLVPIDEEIKYLRAYKDKEEIKLMKQAADISSAAIQSLIAEIEPGCTERELALRLEVLARESGADQIAFEAIVASGENSALPHARPTKRKIKLGDFIVIDFGVKYQGYCSDETCTIALGRLTDKQNNAYQMVKKAHDQAIAAVRANVKAVEIDKCVRRVLGSKYGRYFSHGTGHGVGLEVHETPFLTPNSPDVLGAQMVVTIEPGLYIPGHWGIRIEDTVLVKENSCEKVTKMDKELIIIK